MAGALLSPDGNVIAGLTNTGRTEVGALQGQIVLIDVLSGDSVTLPQPLFASQLKWQR